MNQNKLHILPQSFRFLFESDNEFIELLNKLCVRDDFDWTFFSAELSGSRDVLTEIFKTHREKIDFKALSSNAHIEWDEYLTQIVEEELEWSTFSCNPALKLNLAFLLNYRDKWHWKNQSPTYHKYWGWRKESLSINPALPLDSIILREFSKELDWRGVGLNKSLWAYEDFYVPYGDSGYDEYEFRRNMGLILEFKKMWCFDRTEWGDENECIVGIQESSIFDNKRIDWTLPQLASAFSNELAEYNRLYMKA